MLRNRPHVDQEARDALVDFNLVEDDYTEILTAPAGSDVGASGEGRSGTRPWVKAGS